MPKDRIISFSDGEMFVTGSQTALLRMYGYEVESREDDEEDLPERDVDIEKDRFERKGNTFKCTSFDEDFCEAIMRKLY